MIFKGFRCKNEYIDLDAGVVFEENEVYLVMDYCDGFIWFTTSDQRDYMFALDEEFYEHFVELSNGW